MMDNSIYSSPKAIAGVATPAILLNVAGPLTIAVQTSLIGRYTDNPTISLAAFGAVTVTAAFASRIFNFLVEGVSAKIGKSVGLKAWNELEARVRFALGAAIAAGLIAAAVLAGIKHPITHYVLHLDHAVNVAASSYWWLRVGVLPITLLNMAASGILQGFRSVHISAAINTGQAFLEMISSYFLLKYYSSYHTLGSPLFMLGLATLVTQVLALVFALVCIACFPPPEAKGQFSLWTRWFGSGKDAGAMKHVLSEPLLAQHDLHHSQGSQNDAGPNIEVDSFASTNFGTMFSYRGEEIVVNTFVVEGDIRSEPSIGDGHAALVTASQVAEQGEYLWDFVRDGMHMMVRSMILQATFFMALVAASQLGTVVLAGHSIINQLWVLISYLVDGFASAGVVLGSRLAAQAHNPHQAPDAKHHLQLLVRNVLVAGLVVGVAAMIAFAAAPGVLVGLFTSDAEVATVLEGSAWRVLTWSQPANSLVFIYDGLMYSSGNFLYIRNYMSIGFVLVFVPVWGLQMAYIKALWGIWFAKSALNVWRLGGAAFLIHHLYMKEFDAAGAAVYNGV